MTVRHFLSLMDCSQTELIGLIKRGVELKSLHQQGVIYEPLKNRVLAMIFEKASTRTRVSFEAGMIQLGGQAIFLSPRDTQLGRGEPIEDSARVLSSMCDAVMIRTFAHADLETFAQYSRVPVINGLSDDLHPCQLLADMQTYLEHRGSIQGKTVAWVGDGNNMCNTFIQAGDRVTVTRDPLEAVAGAHLVNTDVWASMGQEDEAEARLKRFAPYQVTPAMLDHADESVLFMHCLPAHRGEEVNDQIMEDPRSVIWAQAENRLHAQKALVEFLLAD